MDTTLQVRNGYLPQAAPPQPQFNDQSTPGWQIVAEVLSGVAITSFGVFALVADWALFFPEICPVAVPILLGSLAVTGGCLALAGVITATALFIDLFKKQPPSLAPPQPLPMQPAAPQLAPMPAPSAPNAPVLESRADEIIEEVVQEVLEENEEAVGPNPYEKDFQQQFQVLLKKHEQFKADLEIFQELPSLSFLSEDEILAMAEEKNRQIENLQLSASELYNTFSEKIDASVLIRFTMKTSFTKTEYYVTFNRLRKEMAK